MSDTTTITVTEPLKDHIEHIRDKRGFSSMEAAVQSIIADPIDQGTYDIEDADTTTSKGGIKVSEKTLHWVKLTKEQSEHGTYEDLLRDRSGASKREQPERPIEWEPL